MSGGWGAPVTVNLLTGFLGSGKTSLLKRLLSLPSLADTAVLINEFGEVGLDHLLVEEVDEEVVLLKSGCVCCTIRGDLRDAIGGLLGKMRRGEVPAFSRLVIETTGLADPAPIVATLQAEPSLRHHVRLGNVVTVVDAVDGLRNLDSFPEALRQAAVADRIVVSKTDLASMDAIDALERRLHELNPTALLHRSDMESAAPELLLLQDVHDLEGRSAEVRRWLVAETSHAVAEHGHHQVDRSRHGEIRAFCLTAEEPVDWASFGLWLTMLLNRHGSEILRVKGLLDIAGVERPVVVQGVQHTVHRPEHLERWPDAPRTRLVVIARSLEPALVERSFRAFLGLTVRTPATA
ncbi:GTP-binding protein [Geminicoccaceae bacterium 1502E]|nr:GTP-binding protein [Geminicoccaceae bacterium 1502E]